MPQKESKLETSIRLQLTSAGLFVPEGQELTFHPTRKWRFDFAWPEYGLALEVHGGIFTSGRHSKVRGQLSDMEKASEAAVLGWRLLVVSAREVHNGAALDLVKRAVATAKKQKWRAIR